jgi:hypothetical protein
VTAEPAASTSSPPRVASAEPPAIDPAACRTDVPQQSCVPGPEAFEWSCKSDCAETCEKCLAGCRGDACKACLVTRDHCSTGECSRRLAEYTKEIRENYGCKEKRPALDICKRLVACHATCEPPRTADDKRDACRSSCAATRAAGCNAHFLEIVGAFDICAPFESGI